jgi:hypothetical protein
MLGIRGDAYEGLSEKNTQDISGGAGQYFTPRPLIRAIIDVMRPDPVRRSAPPPAPQAAPSWPPTIEAVRPRRTRVTLPPREPHGRRATWSESNPLGRWRAYPLDVLPHRDKISLELGWLPGESLGDPACPPDPNEITENPCTALGQVDVIQAGPADS